MTLCLGETSSVSRPPSNLLQLKLGLSLITLSYLYPGSWDDWDVLRRDFYLIFSFNCWGRILKEDNVSFFFCNSDQKDQWIFLLNKNSIISPLCEKRRNLLFYSESFIIGEKGCCFKTHLPPITEILLYLQEVIKHRYQSPGSRWQDLVFWVELPGWRGWNK